MAMSAQALEVRDSVALARFLLGAAAAGGADAVRLARESGLPGWALAADEAMGPSRHALRLWELAEHTMHVPHAPLAVASRHQAGSLELFDYLFIAAATLRDGLQTSQDFLHLVTTNGRIGVTRHSNGQTSYSYRHVEAGSRGSQLAQKALASLANLDGIKADMLLPGHGDPWTDGVDEAIRRARTAGPS